MIAKIKKLPRAPGISIGWNQPPWQDIRPERLCNWMGEKPDHFPQTEVKVAWEETAVHLFFRVEDRFVRAIATHHQQSVCGDSCVEFFFTPGPDIFPGYFNLEMNCGGTMLFHFQPREDREGIEIPRSDCEKITVAHSLPKMVEPELQERVVWTVAYSLPVSLLEGYCPVTPPSPDVRWRVNFYKCADKTSHPHWLTWAPVDFARPNFHLPRSFGILAFER